jgi:hypothetical protein
MQAVSSKIDEPSRRREAVAADLRGCRETMSNRGEHYQRSRESGG